MTAGDKSAEPRVERMDTYRDARRQFLTQAGPLSAVATAAQSVAGAERQAEAGLPQIQLGSHRISRLICGANCFNAGSHLSVFVNCEMKQYYTPERILQTLRRCHEVGINCWASGRPNYDLNQRLLDEGVKMHYLGAGDPSKYAQLPVMAKAGCIGAAPRSWGRCSSCIGRDGICRKRRMIGFGSWPGRRLS